jgi:putative flippase GtrA
VRSLATQLARFGAVGAVGFVIDVVVFNLLRAGPLAPEIVADGPIWAKVISTCLAIAANWLGNRYWTFRTHRGKQIWREGVAFATVSVGGMLISIACLYVSHYVLGFTSILADNIASNVVGLALGSLFRFALYRSWVFRAGSPRPLTEKPSRRRPTQFR